jgi:pimeloyl-ACP methyl ester carboxylesterase/tetratricopeptide (TPR) repeat protein
LSAALMSAPVQAFLPRSAALWAVLVLAALSQAGCAHQRYVTLRDKPRNVLTDPLKLLARGGRKPTARTQQLLRRYDLVNLQSKKPAQALTKLEQEIKLDPNPDKICSYAELAYLEGQRLEEQKKPEEALDFYGAAVAHAYWFLLDPQLDRFRNPYDPQFRRACDLYNESLAAAMRVVIAHKGLKPGETQTIQTGKQQFQVQVVLRGPWHADDIEDLKFVNDYEIEGGLTNQYHTFGLGVPLIAVRSRHEDESPAERYYPPGLCFPVTAFLRVENQTPQQAAGDVHRCTLELYDPLFSSDIAVCNRLVPLETDLSTPLAYFLDQPSFQEKDIANVGLFDPNKAQGLKGLYMVEPYDPNRIPVVFVHGLWSSPTTWMEMFNDLRAFPEIRGRYQFWFFLYPSGQPFWTSGSQLRDTLAEVRQTLDPQGANPNMDQLVLVGHSMGGLVSYLQTMESGDEFWRVLSDKPIEELKASAEERARLAKCFYFHPNPSVKRVITLGTPHRGSTFANSYVRELGRRWIKLPEMMLQLGNKLTLTNPGYFKNKELLTMTTSIDSLAPDCPIFPVMLKAQRASWTSYHNVVGLVPKQTFVGRVSEEGDGVVSFTSAHLDPSQVASEIVVEADHLAVHRHPLAILEVRRILLELAGQANGPPVQQVMQPAATSLR